MLTQHIVADAAQAAGIDVPVRYTAETGSTNSDLADLAATGGPAWTVLVAGHQEAGRGRLGRTWVSEPGSSLLVSVLLRPDLSPADAPLLSLAGGVAAVEGCRAVGVDATCKWPNDVVVGERKLAGILPEASVTGGLLDYVVIGVGLNVHQTPGDFPEELRSRATSVAMEDGRPDPAILLRELLAGLRRLIEPGDGLRDRVLSGYREVCSTIGRRVRATQQGALVTEGMATDIGSGGELLVETRGGIESIVFGEVVHLD